MDDRSGQFDTGDAASGATEAHWADRAAQAISARMEAPVVCTGISPSGEFHVGHLREILTGDAVYRALIDHGSPARLLFVVDDLDPLRKVSPFLDAGVFSPLVGRSLFELPSPKASLGDRGSYADYYLQPFLAALDQLRVSHEVVRAHDLYHSGRMDEVIFTALEQRDRIAAILQEVAGKDEIKPDWSPWMPRCASCRRLDKGSVTGWDRSAGTICSTCGVCGAASEQPAATGGKLTWRVDWPARWKVLGVTVEPFGKDHASKGGSYDTGERFAREIFGIEPPYPLVYEWIALKGHGDMSSSKGNVLSVVDLLSIAPPEVLRYLVMKGRPGRSVQFDPGLAFLKLVDEVDDASASGVDDRALQLSLAAGFKPLGVPFQHLVLVAQIARFDVARTIALLERGGYGPLDVEAVAERVTHAQAWLARFAPDDVKVEVPGQLPDAVRGLAPDQRVFLGAFAEALRTRMDANAIHEKLRELATVDGGPGPKRAFEAVYVALLGRARGPRAGSFIEVLGPDFVADRFAEAARV